MEDQLKQNERLTREYRELLKLQGYPVAVKMLKKSELEEAEAAWKVKRPTRRNTLCQLIAQTYYLGRRILIGADNQACYAAAYVFGMGELPKEAWKRYVGWQVKTEEAGRKAFEAMPSLPVGTYDAVFLSPLDRCPVAPDAMIFFGNASQMLPVVAGYIADRGGMLAMECNGFASCGSLAVAPMLRKHPNIVIPGNPLRLLGLPDDSALGCGIPGEMLEELAENMRFLRSGGGSQYPPTWQIIQWEIQPPIADLLEPGGIPSWLRK